MASGTVRDTAAGKPRAATAAPVLGRHHDGGYPGHRHRPAAPPLPHVVEDGPAGRTIAVEGAERPALGDRVRERSPAPVTPGLADRPEGPFGQV
jgi:hypothetical protein